MMEVFLDVQMEFVDQEQPFTWVEVRDIPKHFQQLFRKQILEKVSKIKSFLSSCLALVQDKDVVAELQALIEETPVNLQPKRRVNHVKKKFKMGHELRMST